MKNIKEILAKISEDVLNSYILLANIVSAEVKDQTIYLKFPSISELKKKVQNKFYGIEKISSYHLNISFVERYNEPFLPFIVLNSKYKNYVFYIKVQGNIVYGFIVQKNRLLSENFKIDSLQYLFDELFNPLKIEKTMKDILKNMYSELKESWTYLHPVIFYNDESINLELYDMFNKVLDNLQKEFNDIKRFVGEPYFTFYDLKNFVDKYVEQKDES